ncbi:MAG: reverse transcriptase domain-containing protein, partial [Lactococcus lactis]
EEELEVEIEQEEYEIILEVGVEWLIYILHPQANRVNDRRNDDSASPGMEVNCNVDKVSSKNLWLGDSGASCHMCNNDEGMFNCRFVKSYIKIGNGKSLVSTKVGSKRVTVIQENGNTTDVVIEDVKYVPGLWVNLFSITKAISKEWSLSNKGTKILLSKGDVELAFDKIMKTENGMVVGIEMVTQSEYANLVLSRGKKIDINDFHRLMGHVHFDSLKKTAAFYGIVLTGTFNKCYECAISKTRQKNVSKESDSRSKVAGERLFVDISSVKAESYGGSKFWILVVDDYSDKCWSIFVNRKSLMPDKVVALIRKLKDQNKYSINHIVRVIRCDDAGENKALETMCTNQGLGIKFEYTGPGTPQLNGRVERKYATLYGRVCTMLNAAGLTKELRDGIWTEAAKTASDIENTIVSENKPISANNKFYNKVETKLKAVKPFGDIAIIERNSKRGMRSKLEDRGRACLYLGQTENHPDDVFRFLDLETKRVILSRDVIWLDKSYGKWKGLTEQNITIVQDKNDDIDEEEDIQRIQQLRDCARQTRADVEVEDEVIEPEYNDKQIRAIRKLEGFFNPEANQILDDARSLEQGREQEPDVLNLSLNLVKQDMIVSKDNSEFGMIVSEDIKQEHVKTDGKIDYTNIHPTKYKDIFDSPKSFHEAWNHECPFQNVKWRGAITLELFKMKKQVVWKLMKRNLMEEGRKCIKFKWVFEIKRDGTFRARLVACGYSQIPGVDFQESYSPVINDVVFRILIVCQIMWKLNAGLLDVEVAFLNGDLDEIIYMEVPDGVEHEPDEIVILLKSMYGLVQAARQFFLKFSKILKSIGFKQSEAEPCLFCKRIGNSIIMLAVHVDDCYVIGNRKDIEQLVIDIESKGLKIKTNFETKDYLSCEILFNKNQTSAWLGQPHQMKKIEKSYGHLIMDNKQVYKTPGTPSYGVVRVKENENRINDGDQQIYRSVVGSLLQLVKYSRPDIANAVRELSKCMDGASPAAFKELKRLLKFVIDTKDYGLKINPIINKNDLEWEVTVFSDSDWGGDKDDRHSVSGYVIFLLGVPILWRSKLQRVVSLSSSEAEYYALSEAAKDVKFIAQILSSVGIKYKQPIIINVDNVGAIFMAENASANGKTKHIDIRYHYVREFIMDNFIKIIFVKSADNKADVFTKNVSSEIYNKHKDDFILRKDVLIDCDIEGRVLEDLGNNAVYQACYNEVNNSIFNVGKNVLRTRVRGNDVEVYDVDAYDVRYANSNYVV